MKNIVTAVWAVFFSTTAMAQLPSEVLPISQHLETINAEWTHYVHQAPEGETSFNTDIERIQLHLQLVVQALREKNIHLNPEQEQQRSRLLDTLEGYAAKGLFPINRFHKKRTPYFIDHNNTHCAVGYLMKASGNSDLAEAISAEHNYNYVADIETEGLPEWARAHGFETSELAWIQPSYPDSRKTVSVGGGVNGEVTNLEKVRINGQSGLIVTGSFDSIGSIYCQGVGFYANGQWQCLGNGLDGTTQYIDTRREGELILCGNYKYNGKRYPAAVLDSNGNWTYLEKPKGAEMVGTTYSTYYRAEFMTYYFPEDDHSELWRKDDEEGFTQVVDIKGRINDVGSYERTVNGEPRNVLVYGGAFKEIKIIGSEEWIESNSLFFLEVNIFSPPYVTPVKELVQDTVLTLKGEGKVMYIGGTCQDSLNDYRGNCLVKLLDSLFIPIVNLNGFDDPLRGCACRITDIAFSDGGSLIFGGKFETSQSFTTSFSKGLAEYDPLHEKVSSYRNIEGYINTLTKLHDGYVVFGGSFERGRSYRYGSWLNNLGRTYDEVGIEERSSVMAIYPNPATDALTIALTENERIHRIRLSTSNGALVLEVLGNSQAQKQLSLQGLPPGMYIAEVSTVKGTLITQKLFVR